MRRGHDNNRTFTFKSRVSLIALAVAIPAIPGQALAQTPDSQPAAATAAQTTIDPAGSAAQPAQSAPARPVDQEIVVTGSRLPSGTRAPTPLTVIGSQAIENRQPATVGELLQQIPSFAGMDSPNTAGVTSRGGQS